MEHYGWPYILVKNHQKKTAKTNFLDILQFSVLCVFNSPTLTAPKYEALSFLSLISIIYNGIIGMYAMKYSFRISIILNTFIIDYADLFDVLWLYW